MPDPKNGNFKARINELEIQLDKAIEEKARSEVDRALLQREIKFSQEANQALAKELNQLKFDLDNLKTARPKLTMLRLGTQLKQALSAEPQSRKFRSRRDESSLRSHCLGAAVGAPRRAVSGATSVRKWVTNARPQER